MSIAAWRAIVVIQAIGEAIARIEIAGAAPDPDVGFLHGILRRSFAAQDTADTGVKFRAGALVQRAEGQAVAGSDPRHQRDQLLLPAFRQAPSSSALRVRCDPSQRRASMESSTVKARSRLQFDKSDSGLSVSGERCCTAKSSCISQTLGRYSARQSLMTPNEPPADQPRSHGLFAFGSVERSNGFLAPNNFRELMFT